MPVPLLEPKGVQGTLAYPNHLYYPMLLESFMDDLAHSDHLFISEQLAVYASRSRVPFSRQEESVICVLKDGSWVPGVRVESASYSLSIPALLNAYTTAVACNRNDLAFVCSNRPFRAEEVTYLSTLGFGTPDKLTEFVYTFTHDMPATFSEHPIDPFLQGQAVLKPGDGIGLARTITSRAYIPQSRFPVACVLETIDGQLIPGVNVEHTNWANILCAERNALGTSRTYNTCDIENIYLTCAKDTQCSPCGACRQLLAELTPDAMLWMDRGLNQRESTTPSSLLPKWFKGSTLKKNTTDC